jgi:NAD-dependent DNA ligase
MMLTSLSLRVLSSLFCPLDLRETRRLVHRATSPFLLTTFPEMSTSSDTKTDTLSYIIPKKSLLNERYEFNVEALGLLQGSSLSASQPATSLFSPHHTDTFKGQVFTFVGHTNLMTRLDFEEFIRHCGGEHVQRVSKKTNYLIR